MKKAYLKKKWVFLVIVSLFLVLINSTHFSASGQEVSFDEIKSSYHAITIGSPKNGSIYNRNQIPLNVTVDYIYTERYVPWRVLSRLFYSIDDEPAKILTIVSQGYTTPIPYVYSTEINISSLSNGLHKIEVVAEFSVDVGHVYVASYNYSSSPATFSCFRDQPIVVSIISPENKTYELQGIALNFTLNEAVTKITYNLDGRNTSINGNVTLSGLEVGEHNLTVFAEDKAGNGGSSETLFFTVEEPILTSEPPLSVDPNFSLYTGLALLIIILTLFAVFFFYYNELAVHYTL